MYDRIDRYRRSDTACAGHCRRRCVECRERAVPIDCSPRTTRAGRDVSARVFGRVMRNAHGGPVSRVGRSVSGRAKSVPGENGKRMKSRAATTSSHTPIPAADGGAPANPTNGDPTEPCWTRFPNPEREANNNNRTVTRARDNVYICRKSRAVVRENRSIRG